jgi:hypothetical protein
VRYLTAIIAAAALAAAAPATAGAITGPLTQSAGYTPSSYGTG